MSISTIEEDQIKEGTIPMTFTKVIGPAMTTVQKVLVAAGDHPRMKFVSGQVMTTVYASAAGSITLEDADGNNITAAATFSTTVFTPVDFVADQYTIVEADEPVIILPVEGNTANAVIVTAQFINC